MTVQTEKLSIRAITCDDVLVEPDPITPGTFLVTASEDMIDVETDLYVEPTTVATTPKVVQCTLPPGAILLVPAVSRELSNTIKVFSFPGIDRCLLPQVDTPRTSTTVALGMSRSAVDTGFLLVHKKNLARGKGRREAIA